MHLIRKIHLIFYRFRERGLEIFLLEEKEADALALPREERISGLPSHFMEQATLISREPADAAGKSETWAMEVDGEEVPSLKALLYEDARQLSEILVSGEEGTFLRVKDALKRVMPQQYRWIKELKDILLDRHSVRDL